MKIKTAFLVVTLMSLFLGILAGRMTAAEQTTVDQSKVPVGPMKFQGQVTLIAASREQRVFTTAYAWKGGVKASAGVMTVLGNRLACELNWYHGTKFGTTLRSGSMIQAVFQPPWKGLPAYTASLAAPTLIRFTSPRLDSHVAVGRPGDLEVRWSGGTPPYKLWVNYLADGRPTQLLALESLALGSANIPYRRFTPGLAYEIIVQDADRRFSFDRAVDPATSLVLRQTATTSFRAD